MNGTEYSSPNVPERQVEMMQQTARIEWRSLQRFFAQGRALCVAETQNLVAVAVQLADDDVDAISSLTRAELLTAVSDDQARRWFDADAQVWAVTVAPYVLVQAMRPCDS